MVSKRVNGEECHRIGKWPTIAILLVLVVVHILLVADQIWRQSPTVDEVAHVPAGLSYLDQRTFRMYRLSPPLARLLAAIGAKTANPNTRYTGTWKHYPPSNHWGFAIEYLVIHLDSPDDQQRYLDSFTRARLVIAMWSAATIPFLYMWGRWAFGAGAGWLAAFLWAFCPNILAHAGLATTDLPATSFGFIASYYFARWLEHPIWRHAILAGVWLGLAQLVKYSSLSLLALWPLWAMLSPLWQQPTFWCGVKSSLGRLAPWRLITTPMGRQSIVIALSAIAVINAGYLFEGSFTPIGDFEFVSRTLTRPRQLADGPPAEGKNRTYNELMQSRVNRFRGSVIAWLPTPLPEHYVAGFDEQKLEAEGIDPDRKYQMYLAGVLRRGGWSHYYLYALAVKTPPSTWLLLGMAFFGIVRSREHWRATCPLALLFTSPVLAMSLLTDINLGLRYILPAFPYLFVLAGGAVLSTRGRIGKSLLVAAALSNVVSIVRIHPHELEYFNVVAGGPKDGRFHLIDSNLDWGQDLRSLARFIDHHPEWNDARLAYWGSIPPEMEGIANYRMAPRDIRQLPRSLLFPWENANDPTTYGPQPGRFAVSVNFERGMEFHTIAPLANLEKLMQLRPQLLVPGPPMLRVPADVYRYFQHFTPIIEPSIGYSILLYDISLADANRVRGELGMPLLSESR